MTADPTISTDAALLQQYARSRDPEAFTEIIRRYAGLVYGTCRRVLQSDDDAQDVSQECFLELARKAGSVRSSLPGYLHKLAQSRSVDAIRKAHARRYHEEIAARSVSADSEPTWSEIAPYVDEALTGLPERIRLAIILHYLQGRTQAQVADELGMNQSTVSRSLDKGIASLRESLKKAGVMVTVGSLTALLTKNAATAAPAGLISSLGKIAISGVGAGSIGLASLMGTAACKCALGFLVVGVVLAARPLYLPHKETEAAAAVQPKGIITTDLATILRGCKKTAASITSAKGKITWIQDGSFAAGTSSHYNADYDLAYKGNKFLYRKQTPSAAEQARGLKAMLGQSKPMIESFASDGHTVAIMSEDLGNTVGDTTTLNGKEAAICFTHVLNVGSSVSLQTGICDLEAYWAYTNARLQQYQNKTGYSKFAFGPPKVVGQETIRGDKCAIVEYRHSYNDKAENRVRYTSRYWINTAKGFTLARVRTWVEGGRLPKRELTESAEYTIRCYPGGIWGLAKSEITSYDVNASNPAGSKPCNVWRNVLIYDPGFQLNVPITNAELTFTFPKGTKVQNEITKTTYIVP